MKCLREWLLLLIGSIDLVKKGQKGYLRLEFEATTDMKPFLFFPGKPTPAVDISDMSSFIQVKKYEKENTWFSGYFFQFGGRHNTQNRLLREKRNRSLNYESKILIIPDKRHKIVCENAEGHIKQFVDGIMIQDFKDDKPLLAAAGQDRVGFYFYTASKVFNVKVYFKPAK